MSIEFSQEQRGFLEQLAQVKIKPTRRQKAIALPRLAEGDPPEKAALCAGIPKKDVETLASDFTDRGLDGVGLRGGDEAGRPKVPSLKDDALVEHFRRIIKDSRKRRARQEDAAE